MAFCSSPRQPVVRCAILLWWTTPHAAGRSIAIVPRNCSRRLSFGNRPVPVELHTPRGYVVGMNGYTDNKADLRKRLSRVEGQVRGISRMVDEDKYCIDILTQVAAATKALETVALSLLGDHLSHCVAQASAEGGEVAAEKVREANDAIARLVRS